MQKYYTRPCNFYYGNNAKKLINNKKALPLAGNYEIAFDQVEKIIEVNLHLDPYEFHNLKFHDYKNFQFLILTGAIKSKIKEPRKRSCFLGKIKNIVSQ